MGENNTPTNTGGIGFAGFLTIVFIVLKLLGKITWPWIWVLSPMWISMLIGIIILGIILFVWVWANK